MKRFLFILTAFWTIAGATVSCMDEPPYNPLPEPEPQVIVSPGFTEPELSFAFPDSQKKRYSYCPVVIEQENGDRYVYMCANQFKDPSLSNWDIIIDNIYMFIEHPDGTRTEEKSVLQPTIGTWDEHHTCDPSVIEGEFKMGGVSYRYAMFYTGCDFTDDYNQLGVAFSNDLNADTWVKYPEPIVRKTWPEDGPQAIGSSKAWGVGQPSAISLDKGGKVLLFYSVGDKNGTREMFRQIDMSDMDHFDEGKALKVVNYGMKSLNGGQETLHNCSFALDSEAGKLLVAHPLHPFPNIYPTFISSAVGVHHMSYEECMGSRGKWTQLGMIDKNISGFPRNHNVGFMRDSYGHVRNYMNPTVYFTVSKQSPDVALAVEHMAEWTYDIYRTTWDPERVVPVEPDQNNTDK